MSDKTASVVGAASTVTSAVALTPTETNAERKRKAIIAANFAVEDARNGTAAEQARAAAQLNLANTMPN